MQSRWLRQHNQNAWVMGVLNCTPDSFSDGSILAVDELVAKALMMVEQGASIIDVGGESTRPDAVPVSLEEELSRVIPVIEALPKDVTISIDTMKAEVMRQAIAAGASMVNDVSALSFDTKSMDVVADSGVDVCLMHMQGLPQTMQKNPHYQNVVDEVVRYFEQRVEACLKAGVQASSILIDPGIGFGKTLEHNLQLIANLPEIKRKLGFPILLGASRKSFLGLLTGADVENREVETAIVSAIGVFNGADVIRVHDCTTQRKAAIIGSKLLDQQRVQRC